MCRRAVGCRYMLLLAFAFTLKLSHIMTNAGLASLHKLHWFNQIDITRNGPRPSYCAVNYSNRTSRRSVLRKIVADLDLRSVRGHTEDEDACNTDFVDCCDILHKFLPEKLDSK